MLASTLEPLHPTLTDRQRDILDESGFTHLTDNAAAVLNCAFRNISNMVMAFPVLPAQNLTAILSSRLLSSACLFRKI